MSSDIGKKARYRKLYMDMAIRVSEMSHCERSKVGSLLVKQGRILSMGWNGTPEGFDNTCELPGNITKPEVIHSEVNLISKIAASSDSSYGGTVYLTLSPCFDCAKLLLRSGIKKVYIYEEYRNLEGLYFLIKGGVNVNLLDDDGNIMKNHSEYEFDMPKSPSNSTTNCC